LSEQAGFVGFRYLAWVRSVALSVFAQVCVLLAFMIARWACVSGVTRYAPFISRRSFTPLRLVDRLFESAFLARTRIGRLLHSCCGIATVASFAVIVISLPLRGAALRPPVSRCVSRCIFRVLRASFVCLSFISFQASRVAFSFRRFTHRVAGMLRLIAATFVAFIVLNAVLDRMLLRDHPHISLAFASVFALSAFTSLYHSRVFRRVRITTSTRFGAISSRVCLRGIVRLNGVFSAFVPR